MPISADAARILTEVAAKGLTVSGIDAAPAVDVYRLKPKTRIGLYRAADNMPGGWLKWVFEQYGFHYREVSATEVRGDLVVVLRHHRAS